MKKSTLVIVINAVIVLTFVLFQTLNREKLIREGDHVLFELRPVDPRSIMQGDYMILRYSVARRWNYKNEMPSKGYMVFTTDINKVAKHLRFQKDLTPLNEGEKLVKYLYNNRDLTIGSESYFFEEGTGNRYERAKYGAMRVDEKGNSTLVGLCGGDKKIILE